jgi:hypothetical protein
MPLPPSRHVTLPDFTDYPPRFGEFSPRQASSPRFCERVPMNFGAFRNLDGVPEIQP